MAAGKKRFFNNPNKVLAFVLTAFLITSALMIAALICWPALVASVPVAVAAYVSIMTGFSLAASASFVASTAVALISAIVVTGLSFLAAKLLDVFAKKPKAIVPINDNKMANGGSQGDLLSKDKLGPAKTKSQIVPKIVPAPVTVAEIHTEKSSAESHSEELHFSYSNSQGS